jgi:hypothetical protein
MAYAPTDPELEGGIEHIAYEYSNLVFAGEHTFKAPGGSIDVLAQNAFLTSCRELSEFFGSRSSEPDIKAVHYCKEKPLRRPSFPTWKTWKNGDRSAGFSFELSASNRSEAVGWT